MLLAFCGVASAQTFSVTFQVDMQNVATVADTVSVAGNFQAAAGFASDWTPGITILTDPDLDMVYTGTFTLPAGSYEYKFINGVAWGDDESVPGACQVNGNRGVTVSGNTVIPVDCFNACGACVTSVDTFMVTLAVNMSNETVGDTVSAAGDFQGAAVGMGWNNWTPGQTVLTDPDMDDIYTVTFMIPEGTYAFKYINGTAWGQDESVPSACAVNNNREMNITSDTTIGPVCFATCADTCTPPLPAINVTFRVNMSNEIVNSGGLFVSGSFQNPSWVKDTLEMLDGNTDLVYEYTHSIVPGEYQYKYYNGPNGDPDGETANFEMLGCGVSNGVGGYNRLLDISGRLTDTILPIYDFNDCASSVAIDDEIANEAFFNLFPNPMSQEATVLFSNQGGQAYQMLITSVTGQVMRKVDGIRGHKVVIRKEDLSSGLYFVTLQSENGARFTRKVIIE